MLESLERDRHSHEDRQISLTSKPGVNLPRSDGHHHRIAMPKGCSMWLGQDVMPMVSLAVEVKKTS